MVVRILEPTGYPQEIVYTPAYSTCNYLIVALQAISDSSEAHYTPKPEARHPECRF